MWVVRTKGKSGSLGILPKYTESLPIGDLAGEQFDCFAAVFTKILQRAAPAGGVDSDGGEQVAQLLCAAGVKRAVGAIGQPGDLLKSGLCPRFAAFVKILLAYS